MPSYHLGRRGREGGRVERRIGAGESHRRAGLQESMGCRGDDMAGYHRRAGLEESITRQPQEGAPRAVPQCVKPKLWHRLEPHVQLALTWG